MQTSATINIALVGNPNSGKSSLFNALTGLNQKVGNFPGVTVDKKTGKLNLGMAAATVLDLPGTYSLYPKSADEQVTYEVLLNEEHRHYPNIIVIVADATNLKRNLLFCVQIMDLNIPVVLALSMMDLAAKKGISVDISELEKQLHVPIVVINPRKNEGIEDLKQHLQVLAAAKIQREAQPFVDVENLSGIYLQDVYKQAYGSTENYNAYRALHIACSYQDLQFLNAGQKQSIAAIIKDNGFNKAGIQSREIIQRYEKIQEIINSSIGQEDVNTNKIWTDSVDKVLLHPVWGNIILLIIMFMLFQSIFWLAGYPMDWIELGFSRLSGYLDGIMPDTMAKDLLINGVLAGIGGVVVFVPQIMILFGLITLLEDTGYMARISFLTDRIMRSAGLNGRFVMPLISGMACAIPAIMATRTIQNRKERLIAIMVTPLMSCSARLPIYTILIALVIPDKQVLGIFNMRGLMLMAMYVLGFIMVLLVARLIDFFIKNKERNFYLMELPIYKMPRWKNIFITMYEKARIFVTDAGKVIVVISVILWALASFGPGSKIQAVHQKYESLIAQNPENEEALNAERASEKLESSYAGIIGHVIEPFIRPLGYDWKIGIALLSSFAAREVFVGTMATLYSVGDDGEENLPLRQKMHQAVRADGTPVYTLATAFSLMIFYAIAMQCMSTLAIVKRETKSWTIPIIQFAYMSVLAYICAFVVYQLLR